MSDPSVPARLLELAMLKVRGWHDDLQPGCGHSEPFETCNEADCRLVREAAAHKFDAERLAEELIATYGSCLSQSNDPDVKSGAHPGEQCSALFVASILEAVR